MFQLFNKYFFLNKTDTYPSTTVEELVPIPERLPRAKNGLNNQVPDVEKQLKSKHLL